ncbi:MAG: FkbM family methyltransferase [Acetobacteraceae bacterium]|nr:FkbM family methyltransferase [Acetobacteraceae bacterium]
MSDAPFVSYAQNREDVMLWRALRHEQPGFYVDAGAADPDLLSVTRTFYDRGWRGLDIEPLPEKAAKLRQARPGDIVIEAALADQPGRATFYRVQRSEDSGLSSLDRAVAARSGGTVDALEVEVTTLAALCREHVRGEVHFLKTDVEGAEAAVLRGMDFRAVRPWIVLVEATAPLSGEPTSAAWEPLLAASGYVHVWFDGLNRFYVAEERHAALAPHFQVPANPFDHYVLAAERRLPEAEALAEARLQQVRRLETELEALRAPPLWAAPPRNPTARLGFRLLRPLLLPLASRARAFLLAPLQEDLAAIRAKQAQLEDLLAGPALDLSMGRAIEAALLTVALERER